MTISTSKIAICE